MADFGAMVALNDGRWTDITGGHAAGANIGIQNRSHQPLLVYFGPDAPDVTTSTPVLLPPNNWPVLPGTVVSKVWALGQAGTIPHVSETD